MGEHPEAAAVLAVVAVLVVGLWTGNAGVAAAVAVALGAGGATRPRRGGRARAG